MPKEGFKCITIRLSMYDDLYKIYRKNIKDISKQGIASFSGFVMMLAYDALKGKDYGN